MSVDYAKLKTNLKLIMHRLKLVEKKKMELNQKARRTIGEFLNTGKVDRARIRVEQIIREDYIIEAMDLIESYCDFLESRFGQLQASEVVDEGLATAVSSLIWVAPRFENDVTELKVIAEQLGRKYGKQYVQAVRENSLKTVNETLMKKLGTQAPSRLLVEKYLVEIAKDQKIDYKPDPKVLKEHEASFNSSGFRPAANSSDEDDDPRRRQEPGAGPGQGYNLIDLGDHYPKNPITSLFSPYDQPPPPLPSEPPLGPVPVGPANSSTETSDASAPTANLPIGFNINYANLSASSSSSQPADRSTSNRKLHSEPNPTYSNAEACPPPNYESVVNKPSSNNTQYYSFDPNSSIQQPGEDHNDTLPELPPVPKDVHDAGHPSTSNNSDDFDFDELTRRFEDLKNKKN